MGSYKQERFWLSIGAKREQNSSRTPLAAGKPLEKRGWRIAIAANSC